MPANYVGVTLVTVNGTFLNADNSPGSGHVIFELLSPVLATSTDDVVIQSRYIVPVSLMNGTFSVDLPVADADVGAPWIYRVTEDVLSSAHVPFCVSIDVSPNPIQYADLTIVPDPTATSAGPAGPVGPAGPPASAPLLLQLGAPSDPVENIQVIGDAAARLAIMADGSMSFGDGTSQPGDVNLSRDPGGFQLNSDAYIQAPGFSFSGYNGSIQAYPTHNQFKRTDQIVNNSTTFVDDIYLTMEVFATVQRWQFEIMVLINSGSTPNFKCGFRESGAVTTNFQWLVGGIGSAALNAGSTQSVAGIGSPEAFMIKGSFLTSGTSGTIFFQWAQNTADPSDTKVLTGSYITQTVLS